MNKDIIKELRIGSYIAIAFYISFLLILAILLYEGQLSSVERTMIIGFIYVILNIFFLNLFIADILKNLIEVLLKEIGELKAKIKNNKDE